MSTTIQPLDKCIEDYLRDYMKRKIEGMVDEVCQNAMRDLRIKLLKEAQECKLRLTQSTSTMGIEFVVNLNIGDKL